MDGPIALVTGASRGIGRSTALRLAERGHHLVVNYREKERAAQQVVAEIQGLGRRAIAVKADLTDEEASRRMLEIVRETYGHLNVTVLNASGGLETDMPADYAMEINCFAQTRVVDLALELELISPGGLIVYVTSHLAHFFGRDGIPAVKSYSPVAASKRAGEDALIDRKPILAAKGIRLVVVSSDIVVDTITPKLLELRERGVLQRRKEQVERLQPGGEAYKFPTPRDVANAIVEEAPDSALTSGSILYVGSTAGFPDD